MHFVFLLVVSMFVSACVSWPCLYNMYVQCHFCSAAAILVGATLDKHFIFFGSTLEAEILVSD